MNDMSGVIVPKSDQINADDLISGPMTITIREVAIKGGQEQPVSIYFHGNDKAFRPCKSMSRVLVAAWGPDANKYTGRSLTLYRDPTVKWGGMDVGGIRISHMTDIESAMTLALTATKGSRKPFVVKPLVAPQQQEQSAGLTLEDARTKLRSAFDLEELRTIWLAKAMAPYRDELADVLAEMKTALAAPSPHEGKGETHTIDPDQLIALINDKIRQQDAIEIVASWADVIAGWSKEDRERVAEAQNARIEAIKKDALP